MRNQQKHPVCVPAAGRGSLHLFLSCSWHCPAYLPHIATRRPPEGWNTNQGFFKDSSHSVNRAHILRAGCARATPWTQGAAQESGMEPGQAHGLHGFLTKATPTPQSVRIPCCKDRNQLPRVTSEKVKVRWTKSKILCHWNFNKKQSGHCLYNTQAAVRRNNPANQHPPSRRAHMPYTPVPTTGNLFPELLVLSLQSRDHRI